MAADYRATVWLITMTNKIYVFIDRLEANPLLSGELILNQDKTTSFIYTESFLCHPDAFSLDPLNLPLSKNIYHSDAKNSTFGVFTDAGADSWGKRLLHATHDKKPKNALEYLLAYSGTGVGCLRFSLSRNSVKLRHHQNKLEDLSRIITAKNEILSAGDLSEASTTVLSKGIGIGGARPKSVVTIDDVDYIAKFQSQDDKFNHVIVENATMNLLQKITDNVAQTRILKCRGEDVLLVKRFDLEYGRPKHHFLSGHSVLNMNKVTESMAADNFSYGFLAEFLMKYGAEPERDATELFKRMVFNVLIGNTDDHPRNHAFLYSFKDGGWRLSPAFDVLPISSSKQHGLGIGIRGREGSIDNLISQYKRFALNKTKAVKIVNSLPEMTNEFPHFISEQDKT